MTSNRPVALWLLTGCFLIFCMVIIGGITRLTGSGLSITEWKPVMGAIPPLNENEWSEAFHKYQQIPQFQKINSSFTLDDFKSIFWWEYIHRLLGRLIGVVFIVPFLIFYFRGMFDNKTIRKVLFLFLLGALQGLIGWLMVKSGLTERTSVSHIRLAIHLITAFITFGFTFYFALELLVRTPIVRTNNFRNFTRPLFFLITIQIIYGAFVAGLHAGKIYTTYPLMNGQLFPDGMFFMNPSFSNFFNNPVMVQFIHRNLAGMIFISAIILLLRWNKLNLTQLQKRASKIFLFALCIQVTLGILTLITGVNIPLAVLHQSGAFVLFSSGVYLLFVG
jgi:cytochrome c oxidase assembly protein subunit 15